MVAQTPAELVKDLPALSSLPAVIDELERSLERGEASMDELGDIVKKDPDLTARLLRLANSTFYGFPKGVETVAEALSLIGLQQLKQLLTGSSVLEYFRDIPPAMVNMRSFWEHSIACGLAAKIIASQRRAPDPELYFVLGLIHDIGRLVFYLQLPEASLRVLKAYEANEQLPLYEYEKQHFGFEHGEVAGLLLQKWDFPKSLVSAVAHHHQPQKADVFFTQTAVIYLADFIVHAMGLGNSGERLVPRFIPQVWQRLDLPEASLRMTIRETDKQFEDVLTLFMKG